MHLSISLMNIHARLHPLINKHSCWYIEQRNYLSSPLVLDQIYNISISKQSRPRSGSSCKSCLVWVCSVCRSVKRRLHEVKGYYKSADKWSSSPLLFLNKKNRFLILYSLYMGPVQKPYSSSLTYIKILKICLYKGENE